MLLFKPEHVGPILDLTKTQTRRLWPHGCRVKVGNIYQARTRMLDKSSTFARLRVKRVWQESLWDITDEDARAEGYTDGQDYILAFTRINKLPWPNSLPCVVWSVEFEVVEKVVNHDE